MESPGNELIKLDDGNIIMWVEDASSVFLKCVTKRGTPVELNYEEIEVLCDILHKLALQIR
jgi:hypothetical protein